METQLTTVDYNQEPVYYCTNCLSLRIMGLGGYDFCDHCGSTDIDLAHIKYWEKAYEEKYGKKYLNLKKNGR